MPSGKSINAVNAINALYSASFQNAVIRGAIWDPKGGNDHTHPNAPLFEEAEWYLTCREVSHAGDTFNTYCQNILADILEADAAAWNLFPANFFKENQLVTISKLKHQRENDSCVREALRKYLETSWSNEIEIIAVLRNKIVHQAGFDPKREVAKKIAKYPPGQQTLPPYELDPNDFPVDISPEGKLMIDAKTGFWASQHALHLIDMMDQNLCSRFKLKRSLKAIRKQSFKGICGGAPRMLAPGAVLPQPLTYKIPVISQRFIPLDLIPYETMSNPKEQACAQTWQKVISEIHQFVYTTCEEVGVVTKSVSHSLAGSIHTHTLAGHDHNLSYQLQAAESLVDSSIELSIRLRQKDFDPYITIWSSKTQMKDYHPCELSDDVKAHLIKSIQQTISG